MPRVVSEYGPLAETTWRGRMMQRRWWPIVRPFVNLFLALALLFFWDPGKIESLSDE